MKTAIPCLYATYGRYTDELRAIPFHYDCLKPVDRRLLYTLHKDAKKLVKSAKVIGSCIGSYHPHGDKSTYDSLVNLVHRNFAIGQGNWGAKSLKPSPAAAYRYTEVKIDKIIEKFAFEYIDFVKWGDPENLQVNQPLYISSPVPIGLIGSGVTSGISFHTVKLPRYSLVDLINRLINIKQRQTNPSIPLHTIIPDFPNFHIEEENPGDFENILSIGKGTLILKPHMTTDNYGVHVWGRPPGGVSTWLRENEIYNVDDMSTKGIFEALFSPKEKVAYDQKFVDYIFKLTTSKVHFNCNVVLDDGTVALRSIDSLIENSYDNWHNVLLKKLENDLVNNQEKEKELMIISIVRQIIVNSGNVLRKVDDIINEFTKSYQSTYPNITVKSIKDVCSKYNITTLVEIQIDINQVQQKILNIQNDISNISTIAYNKMLTYI